MENKDLHTEQVMSDVQKALSGDKKSLESLLTSVQHYIYNIAVRFLWHPQDAEDATQEILIKICTNLSKYKGESQFTTWAYRIALNHLINSKRSRIEVMNLDFNSFASDLHRHYDPVSYDAPDKDLLEEEVKIGCTTGMLLCLTRALRIAYILGDIFEMKSHEAASILDITPELFRKRLQTSRDLIRNFMLTNCGIANKKNRCRCKNMINPGLKRGIVNKEIPLFARKEVIISSNDELQEIHNIAEIYKNHPRYQVPGKVLEEVRQILLSKKFKILE